MPQYKEWCGLLAAFVAAVAFGSYGVPMKGEAATKVDVDPLVFQSYKTFMVFALSWLVLLLDTRPSFTPWGIVSAAFWVPAGTAGIYAVRRAGLAVSVGIWSSFIVFISFLWGIVIFQEKVKSVFGTICAASLLCVGLWGIAFYSSPAHQRSKAIVQHHVEEIGPFDQADIEDPLKSDAEAKAYYGTSEPTSNVELEPLTEDGYVKLDLEHFPHSGAPPWGEKEVDLIIIHDTQYHLGLAMAVVNGALAATIMVPLHYAGDNARGLQFSISFGIGAVIITALMWLIRLCTNAITMGSLGDGYNALPSFHVGVMWRPGCLAGALYSIGNFSSILAISTLGDFMGYSLGQASLLVSGLWGIFYYREISAIDDIVGWLVSCAVVLGGILWLSKEHVQ
mmetsp:Transcript_13563/g.29457  ORF Transcript_13563/g.29457 Transcript_13563/m.29457 type:complete len:394 (+) Transcript_13563:233-1414(+)